MSSGIDFGFFIDRMSVAAEEAKMLSEQAQGLLLTALCSMERTEAIREKYCLR
jgi:hypothetical protein